MSILRNCLIALALPALGLSLQAGAQQGPAGRAEAQQKSPVPLSQAQQQVSERAAAMDANGDGVIDAGEVLAMREKVRLERAARRLAQHDANGDGKVSVEEFAAARHARLAALDADGDGVISAQEFRHGHGMRGERGRHRHGPKAGNATP
ncbi:MAG TPA: EF-hand domain-containing protein [Chiayiivirga sp.]|nr:EF-hand domain-containing protein [Chiayiivirga sp.]